MVWFLVDDGLTTNPKVLSLPRAEVMTSERIAVVGLWTMAGSWCSKHLTDGAVPRFMLDEWGSTEALADRLVEVGMWRKTSRGYVFVNWPEYQPTKSEVEEKRERERKRKKDYRDKLAGQKGDSPTGVPQGVPVGQYAGRGAESGGESDPPIHTHPIPSIPIPIKASPSDEAKPKKKLPELPLPSDWAPTSSHFELARERGVDISAEAQSFRLHAETHDRRAARWNAAFTTWLNKATPQGAGLQLVPAPVLSDRERKQREWLSVRGVSWEEYEERKDEPGWLDSLKRQGVRHG